jgi:hypothetical protein
MPDNRLDARIGIIAKEEVAFGGPGSAWPGPRLGSVEFKAGRRWRRSGGEDPVAKMKPPSAAAFAYFPGDPIITEPEITEPEISAR